ncbi:MAG: hypothetical protein ABJB74_23415 [Gemmatimonas sp.]
MLKLAHPLQLLDGMTLSKFAGLSRFIRVAAISTVAVFSSACSDSATQPDFSSTAYVSIVVSCDVAVAHEGAQWRVSYCTLSLGGGMTGSSLIIPEETGTDRRETLLKFGACVNKKTSTEQQKCFVMLEG